MTEPTNDQVLAAIDAFSMAERRRIKAQWLAQMREVCDFIEAHDDIDAPDPQVYIYVRPALEYRATPYLDPDDPTWVRYLPAWYADESPERHVSWLRRATKALADGAAIGEVRKFDSETVIGARRTLPSGAHLVVQVESVRACEIRPVLDENGEPVIERKPKTEYRETIVPGEFVETPVTERVCPPFIERSMIDG